MKLSDFPASFLTAVPLSGFPCRPLRNHYVDWAGISCIPCKKFPCMHGVSDPAEPGYTSRLRCPGVAFRMPEVRRRSELFRCFRGSIPCLHFPLSTLRVWRYHHTRMTRGRCGSLRLHRRTLSFPTLYRFTAHSVLGGSQGKRCGGPVRRGRDQPPARP